MSNGINKVIIIGNCGKDPEFKFLPTGGSVGNFTVATSKTWKDKQTGEAKEKTEWHRIVVFNKLAEILNRFVQKGTKVYLEGELQTRKWQNQQGQDQYITEIVCDECQAIDKLKPQASSNQQAVPAQQPQASQQTWRIDPKHPNGLTKNEAELNQERQFKRNEGYMVLG